MARMHHLILFKLFARCKRFLFSFRDAVWLKFFIFSQARERWPEAIEVLLVMKTKMQTASKHWKRKTAAKHE